LWLPPGSDAVVWKSFDTIAPELRERAGDRAEARRGCRGRDVTASPPRPHWFLLSMGTRPDRQRQGIGSAVLRPVLERAEVARLETSSRENLIFYATPGFERTALVRRRAATA
jgi:GNAT superfamily N-acetyltransferase